MHVIMIFFKRKTPIYDKIYIFFDKIYLEMQIFICYIIIVKYELVFT